MRTFVALVVVPFLVLGSACGGKAEAGEAAAKDASNALKAATDLMGKASDLVKNVGTFDQVKSTFSNLTQSLQGVTDGASAEQAKAKLAEYVGQLKSQLGDGGTLAKWTASLGSAGDGVMKAVLDQVAKLSANPDVQKAIGPVLDQVKGLLGK
jgi:hypothetical protein